jgi:hypothetical protein
VAILAKGRLVALDRLSDLTALDADGWERVVSHADEAQIARLGPRVKKAHRIGPGRYALDLPLEPSPERLLAELTASGARLVSLNPTRPTLEDLFVRQVSAVSNVDRGLAPVERRDDRLEPAAEGRATGTRGGK